MYLGFWQQFGISAAIWDLGFGIWDFQQNAETIFRLCRNPKLISAYIGFSIQVYLEPNIKQETLL